MKRKLLGLLQIAAAYLIVYWISGRSGLRVDRSGIKGLKPPFIVLGNHTSNLDPALVQLALGLHPCRFLTTNFYFRLPIIGKLLRLFGAIPKIQFLPDIRSTRGALAALARGESVGIFPEGRRSVDGSCCPIPDSIARFIKKANVPVVAVKTNGGYFVWPRWSSFWRSGRLESVAKLLLTTADLSVMDTAQIQAVVCRAMDYNDYDWNRQAKTRYPHRRGAEGLHRILHQCPRCLAERAMRSRENRLYCSACGNTALYDATGFLRPLDENCVIWEDTVQWAAWQRENLLAQLQAENFQLQAAVKELRVADPFYGPYRRCGSGQVTLRPAGLYFHGSVDGQPTDLFFPIERLPAISTEFGYDFEICDDQHAWWVFLVEEQQTVRLETAISLLYRLKKDC
ncbi:phospholipid/glycerol acyltransferase [Lucifera butyrica]|uniref:Phospholipid/glycerol acyltransferase n=1 Tax=Lucifera butyrica TaxID=1351585 RepID=A0A498RAM9_9FIRM|nr:lysophospholipid acyltransferase family protein [Lucifera butyrica]VBB09796.1 phospholipid/glycerol acyltransferase [Lucifera butyrica]